MSCVTPLGEDYGLCAPCIFPFADFPLYSFAVINYSHAYDHMLSPGSHPSNSSNLGIGLGDLNIWPSSFFFFFILLDLILWRGGNREKRKNSILVEICPLFISASFRHMSSTKLFSFLLSETQRNFLKKPTNYDRDAWGMLLVLDTTF